MSSCMVVVILVFFNYAIDHSTCSSTTKIITLPDGKILGQVKTTENNFEFFAFQEIPFASPPVGSLRFMGPTSPPKWEGILNTTQNTKICYQLVYDIPGETEDCLYLNVYTPVNRSENQLLPVLFWIYGGGFTMGQGTFDAYGPQYLIEYNVVIVTINYRIGPLGLLATDDGVIPGNAGFKDQNFALQWTNRNIELFGGDPKKITIMGESAGSASVGFHIISKKSKGLFRAAIMQSGSSISYWAYQKFPSYYSYKLGSSINPEFSEKNSSQELLEVLQNTPAQTIKKFGALQSDPGRISGLIWTGVIENEAQADAFITRPMHEDIKNGNINRVPLLIGINSEEELGLDVEVLRNQTQFLDDHVDSLVNGNVNITKTNKVLAGKEIKKIYTDGQFKDDFAALVKYGSDSGMAISIARHAHLQSRHADVYFYQFSYKGLLGGLNVTVEGTDKVGHGEDLKYFWNGWMGNTKELSNFPEEDITTHHRLLRMWTDFVKYLNPTPREIDLLQNVTWPKVTFDKFLYLDIDTNLSVKENPKTYKQWSEIYDKYAGSILETY